MAVYNAGDLYTDVISGFSRLPASNEIVRSRMALWFLLTPLVFGQGLSGPHSVRGIVRNAVSGAPVRNARVTLDGIPDGSDTDLPSITMLSGVGGEFHFDRLPPGRYRCRALKPEFQPEHWPPEEFAVPGPSAAGLVLNLKPYGNIQGTVSNQFDEPLGNVLLVLYAATFSDGEQTVREVIRFWTDQNGHFVVTRLLPDKYYLKLTGRHGGTETHFGPEKPRYAPWESFPPLYFGGARDRASATPIEISWGSLAEANVRVDLQPAFRIRGRLAGSLPSKPVQFKLLQGPEPGEPQRAALDGATGEFEIFDVLPGKYTLRATAEKSRGEVPVTVGSADVPDVAISLAPGVTVTGSVAALPGEERRDGGCTVSLRDRDSDLDGIPQPGGQFTIPDVFPGEYRVAAHCFNAYPVSVSMGTTDLLANPVITISKVAPPPIDIVVRQGGSLRATLAAPFSSGSAVLLVPSFPSPTGPVLMPANPAVPSGASSGAILTGLPPGEYTAYGSASSEVEFRNPAFLRSLTGGTPVRIEEGRRAEIVIRKVSQ